ncbi:MAG: SDR family NAD(P)-dependent oxidoreductase [Pseudomonadota bacterium]
MKLKKKTVLVTGGTSGIGLELARQLLQRENTVIVTGRDHEKLAAAQRQLPDLHCIQSDARDVEAIKALHTRVLQQFPDLDVLVNNAGIMRKIDLRQERDLVDITQEIDINFNSPVRMVQQFLPHLSTRPGAAIINVSSGLAFVPMPISPIYCATKAAMHSFTQSLRVQMAGSNVTVIELAPPGVETPLFRKEFAEEMKNEKGMDVAVLVARAIAGIEAGKLEITPGPSMALKILSRVAPQFILGQLAKIGGPPALRTSAT